MTKFGFCPSTQHVCAASPLFAWQPHGVDKTLGSHCSQETVLHITARKRVSQNVKLFKKIKPV